MLFRHAVCNELYEQRPFAEACRSIGRAGYTGIEIAPFTLAEDVGTIPPEKRREYRSIIEGEGLRFVGLHWLMASPKGLHVTTPDRAVRERSWAYVGKLIELCADLGPGALMVFGSPKQRASTGGLSAKEATRNYVEGLASVTPRLVERGVTLLVEALPSNQGNDVVNTLDEAVAVVRQVASPAIRTMFDCHNTADETEPHAALVERYFDLIRHVHVNEMDGRRPGTGSYDFKSVLAALARRGFDGWLSLEVFDFKPSAGIVAAESLRYLEEQIAQLP